MTRATAIRIQGLLVPRLSMSGMERRRLMRAAVFRGKKGQSLMVDLTAYPEFKGSWFYRDWSCHVFESSVSTLLCFLPSAEESWGSFLMCHGCVSWLSQCECFLKLNVLSRQSSGVPLLETRTSKSFCMRRDEGRLAVCHNVHSGGNQLSGGSSSRRLSESC